MTATEPNYTRKVTRLWKTKDGRKIRICDMDDKHLLNTIRFLEKQAEQLQFDVAMHPPCFNSEMAQYYAEQQYDHFTSLAPHEIASQEWPIYDWLRAEAWRRGFTGI